MHENQVRELAAAGARRREDLAAGLGSSPETLGKLAAMLEGPDSRTVDGAIYGLLLARSPLGNNALYDYLRHGASEQVKQRIANIAGELGLMSHLLLQEFLGRYASGDEASARALQGMAPLAWRVSGGDQRILGLIFLEHNWSRRERGEKKDMEAMQEAVGAFWQANPAFDQRELSYGIINEIWLEKAYGAMIEAAPAAFREHFPEIVQAVGEEFDQQERWKACDKEELRSLIPPYDGGEAPGAAKLLLSLLISTVLSGLALAAFYSLSSRLVTWGCLMGARIGDDDPLILVAGVLAIFPWYGLPFLAGAGSGPITVRVLAKMKIRGEAVYVSTAVAANLLSLALAEGPVRLAVGAMNHPGRPVLQVWQESVDYWQWIPLAVISCLVAAYTSYKRIHNRHFCPKCGEMFRPTCRMAAARFMLGSENLRTLQDILAGGRFLRLHSVIRDSWEDSHCDFTLERCAKCPEQQWYFSAVYMEQDYAGGWSRESYVEGLMQPDLARQWNQAYADLK